MAKIGFYGQERHALIIAGVPWIGFDEGDWFEFELFGNEATRTEGGDGPSMNISVPQGARATVKLKPTSPSLGIAYALRNAQATNPSFFSIILMSGVQEIISASGCGFGKLAAATTGGPKMSARAFNFECLKMKLDTSAVEFAAGLI